MPQAIIASMSTQSLLRLNIDLHTFDGRDNDAAAAGRVGLDLKMTVGDLRFYRVEVSGLEPPTSTLRTCALRT